MNRNDKQTIPQGNPSDQQTQTRRSTRQSQSIFSVKSLVNTSWLPPFTNVNRIKAKQINFIDKAPFCFGWSKCFDRCAFSRRQMFLRSSAWRDLRFGMRLITSFTYARCIRKRVQWDVRRGRLPLLHLGFQFISLTHRPAVVSMAKKRTRRRKRNHFIVCGVFFSSFDGEKRGNVSEKETREEKTREKRERRRRRRAKAFSDIINSKAKLCATQSNWRVITPITTKNFHINELLTKWFATSFDTSRWSNEQSYGAIIIISHAVEHPRVRSSDRSLRFDFSFDRWHIWQYRFLHHLLLWNSETFVNVSLLGDLVPNGFSRSLLRSTGSFPDDGIRRKLLVENSHPGHLSSAHVHHLLVSTFVLVDSLLHLRRSSGGNQLHQIRSKILHAAFGRLHRRVDRRADRFSQLSRIDLSSFPRCRCTDEKHSETDGRPFTFDLW